MEEKRGLFLAFEGIDGSGKTVQSKKIYDEMKRRGINCILTAEPTDGVLGNKIKTEVSLGDATIDNMTLQILFTADRSDHVHKVILPSLEKGDVVITDRYYWSTMAYGHAFGLDMDWLYGMNSAFPKPDITFWFKVDPLTAQKRRQQRIISEKRMEVNSTQERVHNGYSLLEKKYGKTDWHVVDAEKSMDEVFEEIMKAIEKKLDVSS